MLSIFQSGYQTHLFFADKVEKVTPTIFDMLPSYRTMKYKSPIWGYFHVQKE